MGDVCPWFLQPWTMVDLSALLQALRAFVSCTSAALKVKMSEVLIMVKSCCPITDVYM